MTRRRDLAAGLFYITCHSGWDGVLFRDDLDRVNYLGQLATAISRADLVCVAVVLMTTHAHLILEVDDDALADTMQRLNFEYAVGFNRRHRRRGHVFGGRYGSSRLADDSYLLACYRYVVLNPVEAGLAERPEDWRWSSYSDAIGLSADYPYVNPARVLGCLGGAPEIARARLRQLVEEG